MSFLRSSNQHVLFSRQDFTIVNQRVWLPAHWATGARRHSSTPLRRFVVLVLVALALPFTPRVFAQSDEGQTDTPLVDMHRIPATGDDVHLWFVRPRQMGDQGAFHIAHHAADMGAGVAVDAVMVQQQPEALIAVEKYLYMVYAPLEPEIGEGEAADETEATGESSDSMRRVLRSHADFNPALGRWTYHPRGRVGRVIDPLPGRGRVIDALSDGEHPLVLIGPRNGPSSRPILHPETGEAHRYGLFAYRLQSWEWIALPEAAVMEADVLIRLIAAPRPLIIVGRADTDESLLFELNPDSSWNEIGPTSFDAGRIESSVHVDGMSVVALGIPESTDVEIVVLRNGSVHQVAHVEGRSSRRRLTTMNGSAAIIDQSLNERNEPAVVVVPIDLQSGRASDAISMNQGLSLKSEDFSPLILVGSLLLTFVIMFLFRPNPAAAHVLLRQGTTIADPRRRLSAVLIDLLPSAIVTMALLGCRLTQLLHWPLLERQFSETIPALVMIAFTVAHCTLSEMIFGTTLGKRMNGCWVVSTKGTRASIGAVLLRNFMKLIALIVPLLGLFVFMNPYRQRLGDMAARTIVITHVPESDGTSTVDRDRSAND